MDNSYSLLKLNLSLDQYDTLIESVAKANALTQVILAHTKHTLENIPINALHDFLVTLDNLICKANELCQNLKPQSL